ncbi:phosphoribosylamine--glycine ligase [Ferrithrix thermotolerans DSM 19514]|uniref:Phosphoribosylamine--glycine ligase n=1 Tax=Ferrithrix thermotolerans DSM 19514 TaxID=1121881 RepID=A0A1M4TX45_9ACTN|nr:phosphoribosylamine--glycine ligase [Ferrithrix thermotolerans DSM 19514]
MRVVVVGSGAREHALAWTLSKEHDVIVAPGTSALSRYMETSDADPIDLDADLYVIGPEQPLVDGLADRLRENAKAVFGPSKEGAKLEGSKAFLKDLLRAAKVPTARYRTFDNIASAVSYLESSQPPYVIKTDGLAQGKGVLVTSDLAEAKRDVIDKISGRTFNGAGRIVVIEEGLQGRELSIFALCDGKKAVALPAATDYKRLMDGGKGPNTGGMGAYSPLEWADESVQQEVLAQLVEPTLAELTKRGIDYRGVLYAGVMVCEDGPKIIEFNVRFGDPETQVVIPRVAEGLGELLYECAMGSLSSSPTVSDTSMVTVVLAAKGYPQTVETGAIVEGLDVAMSREGVQVFLAGTSYDEEQDHFFVSGGRVVSVTAEGVTLSEARDRAYQGTRDIRFEGMQYRSDIGVW